jgi:hypothetical protein
VCVCVREIVRVVCLNAYMCVCVCVCVCACFCECLSVKLRGVGRRTWQVRFDASKKLSGFQTMDLKKMD